MRSELPIDVKFRLEAAARVLERAQQRANDPELKAWLRDLATTLRAAAEGRTLQSVKTAERVKTIDDIYNEIREWIWSDLTTKKEEREPRKEPLLDPIEKLEKQIDEIVDRFNKKLEILDKLLEVLP